MPNPKPVTGGVSSMYEHYQQLADEGKMQQEFVLMAANEKYAEMNRSGAYNIVKMNAPAWTRRNPATYRDTDTCRKSTLTSRISLTPLLLSEKPTVALDCPCGGKGAMTVTRHPTTWRKPKRC